MSPELPGQRFIQPLVEFLQQVFGRSQPSGLLSGGLGLGFHFAEIGAHLDFVGIDLIELAIQGFRK